MAVSQYSQFPEMREPQRGRGLLVGHGMKLMRDMPERQELGGGLGLDLPCLLPALLLGLAYLFRTLCTVVPRLAHNTARNVFGAPGPGHQASSPQGQQNA